MLARGALCRLAADVPKTSTHDLPRISQLLRTSLFARHGASQPTIGAIARAFRATILEGRRAYATKSATEPTARVKREVKKAVATKKTAKTAKTAKTVKAAKTTKTAKTKTKPTKAAPKKAKKVLTAEQKEAQKIKMLKAKALLKDAPKRTGFSAWNEFARQSLKGAAGMENSKELMKESAIKFRNLMPAEREHYNQLAIQNTEARRAAYNDWILSHTPEEIAAANRARNILRRKLGIKAKIYKLVDERHETAARLNGYVMFVRERLQSGEFQGIKISERMALVGNEWKALSPSEKKVFEDKSAAAKAAAAKTTA